MTSRRSWAHALGEGDVAELVETRNGGKTKILGGFTYTVGRVDESPMILVDNGRAREMRKGDPRWGQAPALLTAGRE